MEKMSREQWEAFKESIKEAGFSMDRLDDENRDLKLSDDIYKIDYAENYLGVENLETLTREEIMDAASRYVEENIPSQDTSEFGDPMWYDETYDMWKSTFEYTALFNRYISFLVEY